MLPPKITMHTFNALVKPILLYSSEVWGTGKDGLSDVDKLFLRFARCTLKVKATTSNTIMYGELGCMPPSVFCAIAVLRYVNRLQHMSNATIAKQVYNELCKLHDQGLRRGLVRYTSLHATTNLILLINKTILKSYVRIQYVIHSYQIGTPL